MSDFWINWIVQLGIALGTIGAVVVALFGGWLRARLAPPKLKLQLKNEHGSKSPVTLTSPKDGSRRQTESRWYHIVVENERRWSPVRDVQVFLLRIEEPDAAGQNQITWLGDVPLRWRLQEIYPVARNIGPAADCDLCSVVRDKWIELHPLITPLALEVRRRERCSLIVTLQARGLESESNLLRVQIAWDGGWAEDANEMARHLVVREV